MGYFSFIRILMQVVSTWQGGILRGSELRIVIWDLYEAKIFPRPGLERSVAFTSNFDKVEQPCIF